MTAAGRTSRAPHRQSSALISTKETSDCGTSDSPPSSRPGSCQGWRPSRASRTVDPNSSASNPAGRIARGRVSSATRASRASARRSRSAITGLAGITGFSGGVRPSSASGATALPVTRWSRGEAS
ncbi:hypothetical protein A7K94_0204800 [Modestobacter sp. VKM Ac-2676]|nr:hypothetical protein A7K94_0204800 [Modestobacter sp. VKM Ac-2676]